MTLHALSVSGLLFVVAAACSPGSQPPPNNPSDVPDNPVPGGNGVDPITHAPPEAPVSPDGQPGSSPAEPNPAVPGPLPTPGPPPAPGPAPAPGIH